MPYEDDRRREGETGMIASFATRKAVADGECRLDETKRKELVSRLMSPGASEIVLKKMKIDGADAVASLIRLRRRGGRQDWYRDDRRSLRWLYGRLAPKGRLLEVYPRPATLFAVFEASGSRGRR
jgi:hypothetical protein